MPDGYVIESIFIGEEFQGVQSVFVTVQNDATKTTKVKQYAQTSKGVFADANYDVTILYNSQPFFADIDGDLKFALLY